MFAIWVNQSGSESVFLVRPDGVQVRGDAGSNAVNPGWVEIFDADWSPDGTNFVVQAKVNAEDEIPTYFFFAADGNLLSTSNFNP